MNGEYTDFGAAWYLHVATSICITMMLHVFVPHVTVFVQYLSKCTQRARDRGWRCAFCPTCCTCCKNAANRTRKLTQKDYNKLFMGPPFQFEERYASVLVTIFVTLTYAPGIPILIPIAMLNFFVRYWIDKYTILRLARSPPQVGRQLFRTVLAIMPWATFLNLLFGMWMFGNTDIFRDKSLLSDTNLFNPLNSDPALATVQTLGGKLALSQRVLSYQVLPLFGLFVLLAVCFVFALLFHGPVVFFAPECARCMVRSFRRKKTSADAAVAKKRASNAGISASVAAKHKNFTTNITGLSFEEALDAGRLPADTDSRPYDIAANTQYSIKFGYDVTMWELRPLKKAMSE